MAKMLYPLAPVLLVDDEEAFLESASFILTRSGISNTIFCSQSNIVKSLLQQRQYSIILLDLNMPDISGYDLLPMIVDYYPENPVVVITAANEVKTAVSCMKAGAYDYLVKPIDTDTFTATVKRALRYWEISQENSQLKKYLLSDNLECPEAFADIITKNNKMLSIFQYIETIAPTKFPVYLSGETGVGKEMMAKALHRLSHRKGKFVPVNVAGIDDNLFTDTLFGHKRGAFTSAENERKGLIEEAEAGTLLLDEIGDLSIPSQIKLLRLLQEDKYYPLGSDQEKKSDARIVVSTNKNLSDAVKKGEFREDLYYRLKGHHVHIPPLRERYEDIPLLLKHFISQISKSIKKKEPTIPPQLIILLSNYPFPGNIRELHAMIFDALARHRRGILSLNSFRETIEKNSASDSLKKIIDPQSEDSLETAPWIESFSGRFPTLKEVQDFLIKEALKRANGNQGIAASLLGMTRKALNKRLNKGKK